VTPAELAQLIKHVGRGARLAKDLPRADAEAAMRAIAMDGADPVQVGAFLLAMRMKGESPEELAGFADALRAPVDGSWEVDVDLHGDGRVGRESVMPEAVRLSGVRALVRTVDSPFARIDKIGVELADYAPAAARLLALRERIGVRSCVNTAVKLLDPARTRRCLVGIFHSPYHAPVAAALRLLGALRAAVVQAPGGLPEIPSDKQVRVTLVDGDRVSAEPIAVPPAPGVPAAERTAALIRWVAGAGTLPSW
jgi:anthranilate phosphoribosyltransferase